MMRKRADAHHVVKPPSHCHIFIQTSSIAISHSDPLPFKEFIAPARAKMGLLHFTMSLAIIGLSWGLWMGIITLPFSILILLDKLVFTSGVAPSFFYSLGDFVDYLITSFFLVPYMLLAVVGFLPALWLATKYLNQPFASLISPNGMDKRFWRIFCGSGATLMLLFCLGLFLAFGVGLDDTEIERNLHLTAWLSLLPMMAVVIFLQTGAEELLFRGYLLQQLAARWRHPIIWMIAPSIFFALLHFNPAHGSALNILTLIYAFAFGVFATDLTRVSGSLGAAWGMHFINNFFSISLLALKSEEGLHKNALYTTAHPLGGETSANLAMSGLDFALLYGLTALFFSWIILRTAFIHRQKPKAAAPE